MKHQLSKIFIILIPCIFVFSLRAVHAQYCIDSLYTYGCLFGDELNNVSVGTINQTGTGCSNNGYGDYTGLTSDFEQGSAYSLTVTTYYYGDEISMWIDFNDDYVFADSEKLVNSFSCSLPNINYTVNFYIPPFALLGDHRMRIRDVQYTPVFDACSKYDYGEVHDYTANIVPATDMLYASSTTTQQDTATVSVNNSDIEMIGIQVVTSGSLNPIEITSFSLNSNGSTNAAADIANTKVYYTGIHPYFSMDSLFGSSNIINPTISGTQQLSPGANYFWVIYDISPNAIFNDYIDAECTSLTVAGSNYMPTITAPLGQRQISYCTPLTVYSCYFAYIDGVVLNTLTNNLSYCNGNANGYINYPQFGALTTALQQGSTYPISITGSNYTVEGFGVWTDFNDDGDFDDSTEFVYGPTTLSTGTQTGYITIPSNAVPGDHRMRVRSRYYDTLFSNNSCTQLNYGETEDYTITVQPQLCSASFTIYPDTLILHHYWAVNLASGILPLTYLWSWGDSAYDSIAYPSHIYASAGFYTICLTIQDSVGCSSTYCNTYNIQKMSSAEAENTIVKVDVVDSIPTIPTEVQNALVLQSWSVFPNPVSQNVFVNCSLSTPATVSIEVDDVLGNKLEQTANDQPAGESHSIIDVRKLPTGIYFLKIRAGDQIASQKMVVTN